MKRRVVILLVILMIRSLGFGSIERGGNSPGAVFQFSQKLVNIARNSLPSPEADLVLGVVVGYKSSLTREFYDQLVRSGTVHMVVASGYNVMIVANCALWLLLFFLRRRPATILALVLVGFYVLLSGVAVSLVRAALMGGVVLVGQALGRSSRLWWSLGLVVWSMLMIDPGLITNISFQLSVAATFGVGIVAPFIESKWEEIGFRWHRLTTIIEKTEFWTTASAIIMTAPLIWWHFGRFSLISIVSNSLILPLVPLVMALGGAMLLVGLFSPVLASIVAWPSYAVVHLVVLLVSFFGT